MTDRKAGELHQRAQGRLLVERDQHLQLLDPMLRRPDLVTSLTPYGGPVTEVEFVVMGKDGAPLADAEVSLFGGLLPSTAVTGPNGSVRLSLFGEDPRMISGVYVKPRADHWSFYQRDPDISLDQPNLIALRAFSDWPALQNLPGQNTLGWGARAMQLDKVPAQFRGQGIRIAVIDSGAATSHGNLNRIHAGFDVINKQADRNTWNTDTLGHGSHCAGVIAAADPAWGIRGFAPEAEIHVCKLFPGGQISQLIDALEYCIENQIDIVNLSLGGSAPSEALERQIVRAKQAGVACIAAAGNSGGPVQYPASSDHVLAVGAIGKLDEFPPDSYHSETIGADIDAQGVFTARFSCFGPQVDVCAPGVAIVSSVPPNNFAAWDGTSMAAPHVTGLAALVLAHHPEFQLLGRNRSPQRVERLFQILRLSAQPVAQRDPLRNGYGMPNALAALGLSVSPGQLAANWQVPSTAAFGMVPGMVPGLVPGMVPGMVPGVVAGANGNGQRYPAGMSAQQASSRAGFPFNVGTGGLRPSGW
jgi:subtilisin family serine protease